tara:strand:+ start:581 stop:982 length:402 start_codon:yes stop_codon:yes gene_type:complete
LRAIEWKSYEKDFFDYQSLDVQDEDNEEIPITEQIKTPPPPVQAHTEIKVVKDEEEVEETIIEFTEIDKGEIVEVEEVEIEEEFDDVDVRFSVIEDDPIFPGCEKENKSELRNCFKKKINKHILKNFLYPEVT